MASLERTLYKLQNDPDMRDAAFEEAVDRRVYRPDQRADFIADLYAPLENPPANAAAGTPAQLTVKQKRICDLAQNHIESSSAASGGFGKVALGLALVAAAYIGVNLIGDIGSSTPHARARQHDYHIKNENWKRYDHGRDAPWYKPEVEVEEEVDGQRVDGENVVESGGLLAMLALAGIGLFAFLKSKK
jgi:hypothetical protein